MALFPRNPDDAVRAAIEMQRSVSAYNDERKKCGYDPVEIGIGMHTGVLMLGTIGEERRMEGTVISDTVNLASRVENLTKLYGSQIIASDITINSLKAPSGIERRYLDRVKVKGKRKWVDIYEIIDKEFTEEDKLKLRTKENFEKGINLYQKKDIEKALECFEAILKINPGDKAAHLYHQRCVFLREHGVPEEWDGVSELREKYD
jgi:two-component system sensor histidine kinase ChiS